MSDNSAIIPSRLLEVEPITATIVCVPCKLGLGSVAGAAKHVRKYHQEYRASANEHATAAGAAQAFALSEGHAMRETYLSAPAPGTTSRPLPALANLPVTDGFQCAWCEKCYKVLRNVREHGNTVHGGRGDELYKVICQAGMIKVQTIMTGTKTRYFPVGESAAPVGDVGSAGGSALPRAGTEVATGEVASGAAGAGVGVTTMDGAAGNESDGNRMPGTAVAASAECGGRDGSGLDLLAKAGCAVGPTVVAVSSAGAAKEVVESKPLALQEAPVAVAPRDGGPGPSVSAPAPPAEKVDDMLHSIFYNRGGEQDVNVGAARELTNDFLSVTELDVILEDAGMTLYRSTGIVPLGAS